MQGPHRTSSSLKKAWRSALPPLGARILRLCRAQRRHLEALHGFKNRAPTPGSARLEAMQGPQRTS
eukprot:1286133-Karenia_brevis.AAC.1